MSTKREIAIIGATLDLGQGRRGVDMGPSAIRYAGLEERLVGLGYVVRDEGNVETAVAEATALRDERARFLPEIHDTCELIAARVAEAAARGDVPLVLGGDHSVALGTLGGLASVHGPGGVLWIDAHSDINTPETSPSGNVHGMALAAALGLAGPGFESEAWPLPAVDPKRVALVGTALLDDGERRAPARRRRPRVHDERDRPHRDRACGAGVAGPRSPGLDSCTSRSTWTCSIPRSRREWGRRCAEG